MRIIVVNKYYYLDGGPERYLFNLMDYLTTLGHEVIPFSVDYAQNRPSEYSKYFMKPAAGAFATKLSQMEGGLSMKLKLAARSIYSYEAKGGLDRLIRATKPDVVYCLNIVNQMSPSIIDAARKHHVPVVMRLSDYYLVCANYLFLRNGKVCTDCQLGAYYKAIKDRCVHGSLAETLARVAGMYVHKYFQMYYKVSGFVTTTQFMKNILIDAGYPKEKVHHIPTPVDISRWTPRYDNDGYILYYGRLTPEKGIEFLLEAYSESECRDPLMIVGEGSEDYVERLKAHVGAGKRDKVQFVTKKLGDDLQKIVYGARYVVVPSIWHDNAPNVVYESFAAGKPVVASALGGLPEQVSDDAGMLVEPGNRPQLAQVLTKLSASPDLVDRLGHGARQRVERLNTMEEHATRLLELFGMVGDQLPTGRTGSTY